QMPFRPGAIARPRTIHGADSARSCCLLQRSAGALGFAFDESGEFGTVLEDRQNASWSNGFTELVGKSSLLDSVLQHFDDVSGHAGRAVDTTPQTHGQVDAEFERGWNTFES